MPELLRLKASHGRRYVVEAGVIDDRALLGFTMGQCHAMALALRQATGGALVGLMAAQEPLDHLLVRISDGRLVDIGGVRTDAEATVSGGRLSEIGDEIVSNLVTNYGWEPPQVEIASLWTGPVLDAADRGEPHRLATCFVHDFRLDEVLDIHIEWSLVDTGERLTAFGRRPGDAGGAWVRCGVQSIKEDEAGLRVIDFTSEAFAVHARRMEALMRQRPEAVVAHFVADLDPQQPLRPPLDGEHGRWLQP